VVRDTFRPARLREQYSVLRQRGSAVLHQVWKAVTPVGSRGLRTIQDASRRTFDRLRVTPWQAVALRYRPLLCPPSAGAPSRRCVTPVSDIKTTATPLSVNQQVMRMP
jgi:hypothetical protein